MFVGCVNGLLDLYAYMYLAISIDKCDRQLRVCVFQLEAERPMVYLHTRTLMNAARSATGAIRCL